MIDLARKRFTWRQCTLREKNVFVTGERVLTEPELTSVNDTLRELAEVKGDCFYDAEDIALELVGHDGTTLRARDEADACGASGGATLLLRPLVDLLVELAGTAGR